MGYFYCPQHADAARHPFRAPSVCAVSLAVLLIPIVVPAADWWQRTAPSPSAQASTVSATGTASPQPTDSPGAANGPTAIAAPPVAAPVGALIAAPTLSTQPSGPATPTAEASPAAIAAGVDIPARVLLAYMNAADTARATYPGCHLRWQFLAALGEVESHHGRINGSTVGADGVVSPSIYGPALDGSAVGVVGSVMDVSGHPARAMGPMQFIPSTWAVFGDGGNPQDIDDAALAAADYVCRGGRDLDTEAGRYAAAFSYNHADWYAVNVLAVYADYLAEKPGLSRPETPPPGADPAANLTTGPPADSATTPPIPTAPATEPPAGTSFVTPPIPPAPSTPSASSPPPAPSASPASSPPPAPSTSSPPPAPSTSTTPPVPPAQTSSPAPTSNPSTAPAPSGTPTASPSSPSGESATAPAHASVKSTSHASSTRRPRHNR